MAIDFDVGIHADAVANISQNIGKAAVHIGLCDHLRCGFRQYRPREIKHRIKNHGLNDVVNHRTLRKIARHRGIFRNKVVQKAVAFGRAVILADHHLKLKRLRRGHELRYSRRILNHEVLALA